MHRQNSYYLKHERVIYQTGTVVYDLSAAGEC